MYTGYPLHVYSTALSSRLGSAFWLAFWLDGIRVSFRVYGVLEIGRILSNSSCRGTTKCITAYLVTHHAVERSTSSFQVLHVNFHLA
jgi:hypothetical protein